MFTCVSAARERGAGWEVVEVPPGPQRRTDDYSNIVGGLDW